MKCNTHIVRSGFDKVKCFVHARCCDTPFVMAAEWMQPVGCEKYGSDNSIFFVSIEE